MKTTMKWFSMMLSVLAVSVVCLVSCSDDTDEPDYKGTDLEKVEVNYKVDLGAGWYEFWDVTLEYTGEDGKTVTEAITEAKTITFSIPAKSLPMNIACDVKITPKEGAVADDDKEYNLNMSCNMSALGKCYDGSNYDVSWMGKAKNSFDPTIGRLVNKRIEKGVHSIFSHDIDLTL